VVTVQVYKDYLLKMEKEAEDFQLSLKTTMLLASIDPSVFEGPVEPLTLPLTKRAPPPMQRKQSMAGLVKAAKAKDASTAHTGGHGHEGRQGSFVRHLVAIRDTTIVQHILAAVCGGGGHEAGESLKKHVDLNDIFLFGRPHLFFKTVETTQLFMTFYISVCATQILPLVVRTDVTIGRAGWIFGFVLPVVVNLFMLQQILSKSVLLRAVYELDESVAGAVCEDAKETRQALKNLRTTVHAHLTASGVAEEEWPSAFKVKLATLFSFLFVFSDVKYLRNDASF